MLLSHSNLSNVPAFKKEPLLCKWLEKAIVQRVIASLGKQKGRHNTGSCFIDKAVAYRLVDSYLERMGCHSN